MKVVASVLVEVGLMAMNNITDVQGKHIIVQEKCPYRNQRKPSCWCDNNMVI